METTQQEVKEYVVEMKERYREKSRELVDENYNEEYYELFDGPDHFIRHEFPRFAWREMYLGCTPASNQVHLVYEHGDPFYRDRDLLVGLYKQIRDEVKHANIFTNFARQFGVSVDLSEWQETDNYDELVAQCQYATEWEEPQFAAIGMQCLTEIQAAFMISNQADFLEPDYPGIADSLRDIAADEGDHLHIGQKIATRFGSPEDFDRFEEIGEIKFERSKAAIEKGTSSI